jgi:hypothetical protein
LEPDPNGVMRMCSLRDEAPGSPSYGQTINARAKGLFAKSSEPEIQIRFEYLFCDPAGAGELVIYLSDRPDLLEHGDPNRVLHYIEAARLPHPPAGRPGSATSGQWGVFEKVVRVGHLDFIRGTRIELELIGPEGTCILINNWDPAIRCTMVCGDVAGGDELVNALDFLAILSEYGRTVEAVAESEGRGVGCMDLSTDGYVTIHDAMAVDWVERRNLCPDEWLAGNVGFPAYAYAPAPMSEAPAAELSVAAPASFLDDVPGEILVAGKRYKHRENDVDDFLSDRLYGLDVSGRVVGGPFAMNQDRFNGKLVRDCSGTLYQLNVELGLVRLADNVAVVPPAVVSLDDGLTKASIGLPDGLSRGRPLLDAAFGGDGYVYVVPVVVAPETGNPYAVAAKLKLAQQGDSPPYTIERILDDPSPPNDNRGMTQLRQVQVDRCGNVYVLNCHYLNNGDILWAYDASGQLTNRCELQEIGIPAPIGLCTSVYDDSRLYLASSLNPPDANHVMVHVLSSHDLSHVRMVEVRNMGHITDVTEDPTTGTIYVAGFRMPVIPSESEIQDMGVLHRAPFYQPCFAAIPYDDLGPVEAVCLSDFAPYLGHDLALPVSILWAGGKASIADGDCVEGTRLGSDWLESD